MFQLVSVRFDWFAIQTHKVTCGVCSLVFSAQVFYKDDLNWLKGIGCYAWDTPEILRVKHASDLQSEVSTQDTFTPPHLLPQWF